MIGFFNIQIRQNSLLILSQFFDRVD